MNETPPAPRKRGRPPKPKPAAPPPPLVAGAHMIAQVDDMEHPLVGVLFIIGAIRGADVHGFYLRNDGSKEFVTVPLAAIKVVGKSFKTSREPCSPEWNKAANEETKEVKAIDQAPQTPDEINL